MKEIEITQDDFEKFREYFYRKTGIQFEDTKRYFVDKRLVDRIERTDSASFRSYFTMLRFQSSGEELQALTNAMTVNETYFFREEYQFKCLVESILPEIVKTKRPGEAIRIWSMPSSSAEEPYSIALYLMEHWRDLARWDVELVASDIDTEMIRCARRGRYSRRSVQNLPKRLLDRYFEAVDDEYQLCEDVREAVEFTRVNLAEPADTAPYRDFDVIFCRNLLIYFDDASRRKAAEVFHDALRPGGIILLGHSESMSRMSALFRVRKYPEAIVYQKPERL
jgi:chemotaxis protein methyltransferase CheR